MPDHRILIRFAFAFVVVIGALIDPAEGLAGESVFGNVYVTDLLPKGSKEPEQWRIWRPQKAGGNFNLIASSALLPEEQQ
jgi:hypothetical protein